MTNQSTNLSPNQKALRRLLHNRPALFGLALIALSILLAVFAYVFAPDHTPDANEQIPLIALKNPGFAVTVLTMRKNRAIAPTMWWQQIWNGSASEMDIIPIQQYQFVGDSLCVMLYAGENPQTYAALKGATKQYHLVDVAFAVANTPNAIRKLNDENYQFEDLEGQKRNVTKTAILTQIRQQQLRQKHFWLGTDNFGRDNLSRLLIGVRVSLLVGLIAVLISLSVGVAIGAIAGYAGGKTDDLLLLLMNTVWSIPTILLVFAIVLAFGRGIGIIFFAVGMTMWVDVARIVRGQVLALRNTQFVEAAQSMGFGTARILMRHILPNVLGPVMVVAASNFATAILIESGLSYLGFGIQPPTPSWGTMLNENYGYAIGGKPFLALVPALAIMLMVLAFNLVGNGFRDALDVKND
jgi:peptide/nickel transport system permease protein